MREGGGAFPATVPFPRLRPGLSLDLTFSTPRLSESRAWFRNQQTSANLNGEGRRVRFFVRRTTHLKKVSQRFFEMRKYGVKPFPPPPLSSSLTLSVCLRFRFLFPCYPTSQNTFTACYPPDHTKHTTSSVVTEMRSGVKRYSIAG